VTLFPGAKTLSSSVYLNPHFQQEAYQPKYCTLEDFEDYYQADVTADTVPTVSQALKLLQIGEAEIDSHEWGRYIQEDEYLDGQYEILTFQWRYVGFFAQVFYPHHTNILRVIDCAYNSGGVPSSDATWTKVTEGPANNSSFVVLRKPKLKTQVGSALLFYSNVPYPGPLRLRLTYEYGMDIDKALLREWAGKKAAKDALEMRSAAEHVNINLDAGPWAALYKAYGDRLKELANDLFPKKVRKIWVYPSTM
jgi:hypothetical protein